MDLTTNVVIITKLMKGKMEFNNTYQEIENYISFYPSDFFCPKSHKTGEIRITENTICIHHFAGSWQPASLKIKTSFVGFLIRILGENTYVKIKKIVRN